MSLRSGSQAVVDQFFSRHANTWEKVYDRPDVSSVVYQQRQAFALHWIKGLHLETDARLVDIGCGAGHAAASLASSGLRVVATDSVSSMLALASRNAAQLGVTDRVTLSRGDVHALAFRDSTFDAALALGILPWLHAPQAALHEIARVIRPGGWLIVSADNRSRLTYLLDPRMNPYLAPARRLRKYLLPAPQASARAGVHAQMHTPAEFDHLLRTSGFEKIGALTCGFGPFTFLGHDVVPHPMALQVNTQLQRLANGHVPWIRSAGSHYLVLARKPST